MLNRITMRDVAQRSGYSLATVSRALRDLPHVPDKTRTLIQQTARSMGYRPDTFLATLAAQRWHHRPRHNDGSTLAVIVEHTDAIQGRDGIRVQTAHLGYKMEQFLISKYPSGQRLSETLRNCGIQGVLVSQVFSLGFLDTFDWSHFSAVAVSEGSVRPPTHLVMPNHYQAVQHAWDHAVQLGYQRIGMVIFDQSFALDFHDRRAAFFERQADFPSARRLPVLALPANRGEAECVRHLKVWMQQNRPDVVLGFNEYIEWLMRTAGIRVPQDAAFLSLWNREETTPLAGMQLSPFELGRRAVNWLDSLLRSGDRGLPHYPSTLAVDFLWQDGISAPPSQKQHTRSRNTTYRNPLTAAHKTTTAAPSH